MQFPTSICSQDFQVSIRAPFPHKPLCLYLQCQVLDLQIKCLITPIANMILSLELKFKNNHLSNFKQIRIYKQTEKTL